ncbi:hypothetical protein M885DRAFT_516075 [Pelagophyceae sp. CCMP2097]|nr:hypothetical protein M885DRAFT_516075 [Pelagophyceae sp. CCMP2097]
MRLFAVQLCLLAASTEALLAAERPSTVPTFTVSAPRAPVDGPGEPQSEKRAALKARFLGDVGGGAANGLKDIDSTLDSLAELNPTPQPGAAAGFGAFAQGNWRVAHAPHIAKISKLALTSFPTIEYQLGPCGEAGGAITAHVQYDSKLVGTGWLSTRGTYGSKGDDVSFISWDEAWWNPGADSPTASASEGFLSPVVSFLGNLGFVDEFARFPVSFLDEDLVVFTFPLSNTRIAAVRVLDPVVTRGPSL